MVHSYNYRVKTLFLSLMLMFTTTVVAHDFEVDGIYYEISDIDEHTVSVTCMDHSYSWGPNPSYSGEVNIPATVEYEGITYDVTAIGMHAFARCSDFSVNIPSRVILIDDEAFSEAYIDTLVIPEGVKRIANNVFYQSTIVSVTLPSTIEDMGNYNFYKCHLLSEVIIAEGCKTIGDYGTFEECWSLSSINIPESITAIGNSIFYHCDELTSVNIPSSVTHIGRNAFYNCFNLTSITIPEKVTTIRQDAFTGTGLKSVYIPKGVTLIDGNAFGGCIHLTSISVDEENPVYDSRNNCNAIIETASNTLIQGCKTSVIPESVTSIGKRAFYYSGLTEINIPDNVTSIGWWAFDGNSELASVVLPQGLTTIEKGLFRSCESLTDIVIPQNVESIGSEAFAYCKGLTSIVLPNSVSSLGADAFRDCSSLTSLSVSANVTSIGGGVFSGCNALEVITVDEGNTVYDSRNNCNAIIETASNTLIMGSNGTVIPDEITAIGYRAFAGLEKITEIVVPESVKSIGMEAFSQCRSLTAVVLPEGLTEIDYGTFDSCVELKSVNIPTSVTSIGEYAFQYTQISEIALPEGLTTLGSSAFESCHLLKTVTLPESISEIGVGTFGWCDIDTIYCKNPVPCYAASFMDPIYGMSGMGSFSDYSYQFAVLFVPIGSKQYYMQAEGWNFLDVREMDFENITGIIDISTDVPEIQSIYSLEGRKLPCLQKGINVIRYSDGTSRKVFVGNDSMSEDDWK